MVATTPPERIHRQIQQALQDSHPTVRFIALDLFRYFPNSSLEQKVVSLVGDRDRFVKWLAIAVCGSMNLASSLDALFRTLHASDPATRQLAANALGQLGDTRALPVLAGTFQQEGSASVRKHLIRHLDKFAEPPWDLLTAGSLDSDMGIRLETARILGHLAPDPGACEILVSLLERESNNQVFATALLALGRFRRDLLLSYFEHSLLHQESRVRANAVEAMGNFPLARVEPIIVPYLQDPSNRVKANVIGVFLQHAPIDRMQAQVLKLLGSANPWDRASGAWVAGTYRLAGLFPNLVALLREEELAVATRSAWAIGRIADRDTFAGLTRLFGQVHSDAQAHVLEAMGNVAGQGHVQVLANLACRELNPQLKARIIDILIELKAVGARDQIRPMCKDPDPRVRSRALAFLTVVSPREAAELLVFGLRDPQPALRRQCAEQLLRLGDFRGLRTMVQCLSDPEKERVVRMVQETNAPPDAASGGRA